MAQRAQQLADDGLEFATEPSGRRLPSPRLFVFARHAESTANVVGVVSSDPGRPAGLTARGSEQARRLGAQVAGLEIDLAVATRLVRTQQTLELALSDRTVPVLIDPRFDEIRAGDCDGAPIEDYWAWRERHGPEDHFPHGESLDEARIRYASALRALLSRVERVTLVVVHELALRWIAQAATDSPLLLHATFGNTTPYFFDEHAVTRAAAGLEAMARSLAPD